MMKLLFALLLSVLGQAATITTSGFTAGTLANVSGITNIDPLSLTGLGVTADFDAGVTLTCTFVAGDTCSASQSNNGFTFSWSAGTFTLSNTSTHSRDIIMLTVDLGSSPVVFDRTAPNPGTTGSGLGLDLFGTTDGSAVGSANYTNAVTFSGNAALNDIFKSVVISFSPGVAQGETATFTTDVDQVTAMPEPGTWTVVGMSTLAFAASRIRRKSFLR